MLGKYLPQVLRRGQLDFAVEGNVEQTSFDGIILCIDIVQSTLIVDHFSASGPDGTERLAEMLNRYFGRAFELIQVHGGDILRVEGDAVLAFWLGDVNGEAALSAAVAIRKELHNAKPAAGIMLQLRFAVTGGKLKAILLRDDWDRRFFVLTGRPIIQLSLPAFKGEPGEIRIGDAVARYISRGAALGPTGDHASERPTVPNGGTVHASDDDASPATGLDDESIRGFLPRVVTERLNAGQSEWLAEFRKLSVAFVNIDGLNTEGDGVAFSIANAVGVIQRVLHPLGMTCSEVVASEKGFIVVVACGEPSYSQENNALWALASASRIKTALSLEGTAASIGVATGNAFCCDIGTPERREYVRIGSVMSRAARLMSSAAGDILCDAATAEAAAAYAEFEDDTAAASVEGRPGRRLLRVPEVPRAPGKETRPVFGRERECKWLDAAVARLADGNREFVVIEAEAGAGKTHLLAHIGEMSRSLGFRTASTATSAIEKTTPYFLFRQILPQLIAPHDPSRQDNSMSLKQANGFLTSLGPKAALLEDILPLGIPPQGFVAEIAGLARVAEIQKLVVALARNATRSVPLVILIDDLHWADTISIALLRALIDEVPSLMVAATRRPEEASQSNELTALIKKATTAISLAPLACEAVGRIISSRAGATSVAEDVSRFIYQRSAGLPLFAEQLAFLLIDRGTLVVEDNECRFASSSSDAAEIPTSLRDLIVSRIDRLGIEQQITLKVASAIGGIFSAAMVGSVDTSARFGDIEHTLRALTDHGMLAPAPEAGAFQFRHSLLEDVTYGLISSAQRRPLHRRIAQYIEARNRTALAPHYAELAAHWERGEGYEQAVHFHLAAANLALRRYANREAIAHVEKIDRLSDQGTVQLSLYQREECARIRADAYQELGEFREASRQFRVLAALQSIPFPRTRVGIAFGLAIEAFRQFARRLSPLSVSVADKEPGSHRDRLAAHIYVRMAEHAYFSNDSLGVAYGTLASLNRAERARSWQEWVNSCAGLSVGLATVGLAALSRFYRDRSLSIAASAGSLSAQGYVQLLACVHAFHFAEWTSMAAYGERGAEIWEKLGDRYREQSCLVLQGYRLLACGAYNDARASLFAFGERGERIESPQVRAWFTAAKAMIDVVQGQAPETVIAAVETAVAHPALHHADLLLLHGIKAAVLLEAERYDEALAAADAGLALMVSGSPAMAGSLLFGIPSLAETLLALAERPHMAKASRRAILRRTRIACRAVRTATARNRMCRPRGLLIAGRDAFLHGRNRKAARCWRLALRSAEELSMPLEAAAAHLALSALPGEGEDAGAHAEEGREIMTRLGAVSSVWAQGWGHLRSR